jgi:hypothetical protein
MLNTKFPRYDHADPDAVRRLYAWRHSYDHRLADWFF